MRQQFENELTEHLFKKKKKTTEHKKLLHSSIFDNRSPSYGLRAPTSFLAEEKKERERDLKDFQVAMHSGHRLGIMSLLGLQTFGSDPQAQC